MKVFLSLVTVFSVLLGSIASAVSDNQSSEPIEILQHTHQALADSQHKIDQLDSQTSQLLKTYRELLQKKDYQQYYNFQLQQQDQAQREEIANLRQQLAELDSIEVLLMPLLQSMLVALEEFVVLDVPFHLQTRMDGLQTLRSRVYSGAHALPDKYRLLMEAWQIEYEYGRSVESWRDTLSASTGNSADSGFAVTYLRVGRVGFYYLTLDESEAAIWDKQQRTWQMLPQAFVPDVKRAIHIASERIAPELLPLPMTTEWGQHED